MLMVNFAYDEVQNVLHSLTQLGREANNPKDQEGYRKAADKIKTAINKKGILEFHQEGQIEVNDFRNNDMVKQ